MIFVTPDWLGLARAVIKLDSGGKAPAAMTMLMHAMFFGLPLGLMYAGTERHARHAGGVHARA